MKYKFLIFLIILFFTNTNVVATSNLKKSENGLINEFLDTAKEYSNEIFPELEDGEILENIIKGDAFTSETIFERILGLFTNEIKSAISIALKIIAVSVICSLLKNIQIHNENNVRRNCFLHMLFICCYISYKFIFGYISDMCRIDE